MDQAEKERLLRKKRNLLRLEEVITEHQKLLKDAQKRANGWSAQEDVVAEIRSMFIELSELLPEKNILFNTTANFDALQLQLLLALSKARDGIDALSLSLGETPVVADASAALPEAVDKRRVFVVHGRNMKTKDAMLTFLRSIKLDPIEWEEAVHMTGSASPSTGQVLDAAFSNAQAVVILITGDDIACLGEQFVQTHDALYEKELTPQARPNVIFEMGMAFGKHPNRTLIVEFGITRTLSDVHGINTIRFQNDEQSRKRIAGRLKTAKCLVDTEHNLDWLKAGDFSSAFHPPIHTSPTPHSDEATITKLKTEIATRNEENSDLRKTHEQLIQQVNALEADLKQQRAKEAASNEQMTALRNDIEYVKLQHTTMPPAYTGDIVPAAYTSLEAPPPPEPALSFRFDATPPFRLNEDRPLALEVVGASDGVLGFRLSAVNTTPKNIAVFQVEITEANCWNQKHSRFLEGQGINRKPVIKGENLGAVSKTSPQWFIRVVEDNGEKHLTIYNDATTLLLWPNDDPADVQIWKLTLASAYKAIRPQSEPPIRTPFIPLPNCHLLIKWHRSAATLDITPFNLLERSPLSRDPPIPLSKSHAAVVEWLKRINFGGEVGFRTSYPKLITRTTKGETFGYVIKSTAQDFQKALNSATFADYADLTRLYIVLVAEHDRESTAILRIKDTLTLPERTSIVVGHVDGVLFIPDEEHPPQNTWR